MIDIYEFDEQNADGMLENEEFEEFQDALVAQFLESAEAQALNTEAGFWTGVFLHYGFVYEGYMPSSMDQEDVAHVILNLLPRKVAADEWADALPELNAFWHYLDRVYQLPRARGIAHYLRGAGKAFDAAMRVPHNWGMAKSMVMQGEAAGFDMTDSAESSQFINLFNQQTLQSLPPAQKKVKRIRKGKRATRAAKKRRKKR